MNKFPFFFVILLVSTFLVSCQTPQQQEAKIAPQETPKPLLGKITINWQSGTRYDIYGFNIYRSKKKEGPFEKLNKEIIPGPGSSRESREFHYVDQPLEIGETYHYYVESVSFAGKKEPLTPVTKVIVKTPIKERK